MIDQTTVTKLNEMRLTAMAESFKSQLKDSKYQELSFEEHFGLMVDIEWSRRKTNSLNKLIKKAELRFNYATIEDIEYHEDRKLDKTHILRLATCNYSEITAISSSWAHLAMEKATWPAPWGLPLVATTTQSNMCVCFNGSSAVAPMMSSFWVSPISKQ